jgi:hypothetical protein
MLGIDLGDASVAFAALVVLALAAFTYVMSTGVR